MIDKKTSIAVVLLTVIMTFMEMSALPAALFVNIQFYDVSPIYFVLMANFLLAFVLCWLFRRFFIKEWCFGLQFDGLWCGLKKYGIPALIVFVPVCAVFCFAWSPLENTPTVWRVIVEGLIYYIGVGIMEELYLRGLLQNIVEKWFGKCKYADLYSIVIASVLFGLGHIFGALGQPIATVICKTVWAAALGVYFGSVYVCTRNLWVPIILHLIINMSASIPACFTTSNEYPILTLTVCLISYLSLGGYGIWIVLKNKEINGNEVTI